MASKRVNTKFVFGLGAVLLLVAVAVIGAVGMKMWRESNPDYWLREAEKAKDAGDLNSAIRFTSSAAQRASNLHRPNTDKLYMKLADMCMQGSAKNSKFYGVALNAWKLALTENPRNLEAQLRLMEEDYQIALANPPKFAAQYWNQVRDRAAKLIEMAPNNAQAHTYRAAASLELLRIAIGTENNTDPQYGPIEADVTKALSLDSNLAQAVVAKMKLRAMQAATLATAGQEKESKDLQQQAVDAGREYLVKNHGDPQVSLALGRLLLENKQIDDARSVLETAYKAHPTDREIVRLFANLNRSDAQEKILQDYVSAVPNDMNGFEQLARFYQATGHQAEAINAFKTIVNHENTDIGAAALHGQEREIESLFFISWLYMDLAEISAVSSADGKADLTEGSSFIERFRSSRPAHPLLDLLDGRMQLLRKNIPQAMALLRRANETLGAQEPNRYWLFTKLKLAQAYEEQKEWGNALEYLDQVMAKIPGYTPAVLHKAYVLNQVAQFAKALELANAVLRDDPGNTTALRTKAEAFLGLGESAEYYKIMNAIDSVPAMLELARVKLASGDVEGARILTDRIFEKDPENMAASSLAVLANMQLGKKDQAEVIVQKVLTRDPKNTQFQMLQAAIKQPNEDSRKIQEEIIRNIEDPYTRNLAFAQIYQREGDKAKEMDALLQAEKSLDPDSDKGRNSLPELVDRIFALSVTQATQAKDPKVQREFWEQAQRYVEKAERLNLDGVNGKLFRGRLQMAQGAKKEGVTTLEQAVATRPDYSLARTVLGQAYYEQDRKDEALEEFKKAIEQKPDNIAALKGAIALHARKADRANLEAAAIYLRQAMVFAPQDPTLRSFSDFIGDPAEAIRLRENAYRRNPDDDENTKRLALLYVRKQDYQKAAVLLKALYEKKPDDLDLADNLARVYRESQQTNEALTILQGFTSNHDQKTRYTALMLLGEMYRSLNNIPAAVTTYRQAVEQKAEGSDEAERRLADLYFDIEDMKNAEEVYARIYDREKGTQRDIRVLRRLVETMIRQEKYSQAQELLGRILKDHPDDPEGLVLRGFALLRQRKANEAIESFNRVLAKNPNNIDALHYRAFAQFYLQGDMDQAVSDLVRVRDQNANAINSRLLLARVYRLARKYAEASNEYADVLKLRPDLVSARIEYANYLLDLASIYQRISKDAQDDFSFQVRTARPIETLDALLIESRQRFKDQPGWRIMQGNLLTIRGKSSEAARCYEDAFHATGDNPQFAGPYLGSLLNDKNYEDVVTLASKLIQKRSDIGDLYVKRGSALAAIGKINDALTDFDQALALNSRELQPFLNVLHAEAQAIPGNAAIDHLAARIKANPKDVPASVGLGQMYLSAERYDDCVNVLKPLLTDPTAVGIKSLVLRLTALAHYQNKEFDKSLGEYQELLKIEPEDLEALNNVSFLLADDLKRPKDGMPYAEQAIKILRTKPVDVIFVNNGNLLDTYGWLKFLNGDLDGALVELNRANQVDPLAITYLHIARVQKKQNNMDDARKAVQECIRLATAKKDPILATAQQFQKDLGAP